MKAKKGGTEKRVTFNVGEEEPDEESPRRDVGTLEAVRPRHVIGSVEMLDELEFPNLADNYLAPKKRENIKQFKPFVNKNKFADLDVSDSVSTGDLMDLDDFLESIPWRVNEKKQGKMKKNKKTKESQENEMLEIHAYLQNGILPASGVPSWKKMMDVIESEKDPKTREDMVQLLEKPRVENASVKDKVKKIEENIKEKAKESLFDAHPNNFGYIFEDLEEKRKEINYCGTTEQVPVLGVARPNRRVSITIDSGAAESVTNEKHFPEVQTVESDGSRRGVEYVNANGSTMPNRGQKVVPVKLSGGGTPVALRLQVTDVQRTLLSVSKVCDSGHEVTFRKDGGDIKHVETNTVVARFQRVNGVYRMDAEVEDDQTSGFSRPE